MDSTAFEQLLISEDDLEDSFFGEEPSAAFGPQFVSGHKSGRTLMDLVNMLTLGTHPETKNFASALFTNSVGSVVFHNVTEFGNSGSAQVHQQFTEALRACTEYRMMLSDGAQFDVTKLFLDEEEDVTFVRWLTTADPYRIEASWALSIKGDVLSFVNTRSPDKAEIRRLAKVALDRIESAPNS